MLSSKVPQVSRHPMAEARADRESAENLMPVSQRKDFDAEESCLLALWWKDIWQHCIREPDSEDLMPSTGAFPLFGGKRSGNTVSVRLWCRLEVPWRP